jgi:hypothetical protein
MKKILALALALLLTLLPSIPLPVSAASSGRTFYISSSLGSDEASGLSVDAPWRTFANLSKEPFVLLAGYRVLLRRGDVWHERLVLHGTGTSSAWISVSPYGPAALPKPQISLSNGRDDICVLAEDLVSWAPYAVPISYLSIEGLDLRNSRLGIYLRLAVTKGNKGFRVRDCDFTNMRCDEVLNAMKDGTTINAELAKYKGGLASYGMSGYQKGTGGGYEYVWPAAIDISGVTAPVTSATPNRTKFSEVDIAGCVFDDCTTGIISWFYNCHPGTHDDVARDLVSRFKVADCVATGLVNGIVAFDSVDGGYTGDASGWGTMRGLRVLGGAYDVGFPLGTTGAILQNDTNLLFEQCEFSFIRNNGNPDGCGFDFESNNVSVVLRDSVFHDNQGQGLLIMRNDLGANRDLTIERNLFYNNLTSPSGDRYNWDICIWTDQNRNVRVANNRFYLRDRNPKSGEKIGPIGGIDPDWLGRLEGIDFTSTNQVFAVAEFHSRWSFDKAGSDAGWSDRNDWTSFAVADGNLRGSPSGPDMYLANPKAAVNPFLYRILRPSFRALAVAGTGQVWFSTLAKPDLIDAGGNLLAGRLPFDYAATTGTAANTPRIRLGSSAVWVSPSKLLRLDFDVNPSTYPQALFEIDSIEMLPDIGISAAWLSPSRIRVTLSGGSFPMLGKTLDKSAWKVSGLPTGVSVRSLVRLRYDMADLELTGNVSDTATRSVSVSIPASQFIEPFARMIGNRDAIGRTVSEEASAAGTSLVQEGYAFAAGALSASVKKSAAALPTDAPPTPTPTMSATPAPTRKATPTPAAGTTTPGVDVTPVTSPEASPSATPGGGPKAAPDGIPPYVLVLAAAFLFAAAMVFLAIRRRDVSPKGPTA